MIRIHMTYAGGFATLIAAALLASTTLAQEVAKESGQKPTAESGGGIFDVISNLFGGSPSAEVEKPTIAPTPSAAPGSKVIITIDGVGKTAIPATAPTPAAAKDAKVKIQTEYAAAVREAQLKNRPLLVLLGAQWCSWCRKLEAALETPEAEPILSAWIVAEVDVDKEPEVAARLEASALPGLRILGPFQNVVASREGYLEIAELKQWLDENRKAADPTVFKVLYETGEPNDESIAQLVGLLADSSPMIRGAAMDRLAAHSRVSAAPLVQVLKTGRLVQQLSACEVFRRMRAPVDKIDPWQPETLRTEQFAPLVEWARQRMDAKEIHWELNSKPASPTSFDAQSADDLLQRLIKAEPAQRAGLVAQLLGMGAPLAVEIRARLARADALDDDSRERLRELLYNLLASGKLRLEQSGVLAALARLDLDSHRQASATILDKATLVDQPLADELARDSDPLVRELAVRAFGRLGMMSDKDRVQQLLNDGNPNVRTAVLRVLTEHPSNESVETLCEYLTKETDEDLLVHGAKCLGQLPRQLKAMLAMARLATNPSWRVRATAIEVTGQVIQNRTQQPVTSADGTRAGVPRELSDAILAALLEHDAFVAQRAAKVVPLLIQQGGIDENTMETIGKSLADHPDQFRMMIEQMQADAQSIHGSGVTENLFPPLVRLAKAWLTRGRPEEIQRAAILLSRLAPTELDNRVGELIASPDAKVRLAGLQAATHSIEKYRTTDLNVAVARWATRSGQSSPGGQSEPSPWYALPKDEAPQAGVVHSQPKPLAEQPPAGAVVQKVVPGQAVKNASPAPQTNALDAVSQLFGNLPTSNPPPTPSATTPAPGGIAAVTPAPTANVDDGLELPSKWMMHWQSGKAQDRPKWLIECEASTQKLLASKDPTERTWALALWLLLGHTDHVDELLAALAEQPQNKAAQSEIDRLDLLSWLPVEKRLAECKTRLATLGDHHEKAVELLRQCTWIDDQPLADWIFEHLKDPSLSDPKVRASLAEVLLRSKIGGFADAKRLKGLSAANYEYGQKAPYRVTRSKLAILIPGRVAACDWLRQRYQSATSDSQRSIALLAVAQLDHKTAVDAAIGAIEAAKEKSEPLQVALSIVLGDAPIPSAQRAALFLSHPLPAVQVVALKYLASPPVVLRDEKRALTTVAVNESPLPALWQATEKLPTEKLHALAAAGPEIQQSQAKLLLVAAGEHLDLKQLDRAIPAKHRDYAKLCIAAALAKAGRNDREAVDHYQQTYNDLSNEARPQDVQILAALYQALRDLPGNEVAELRRRMRNEKGSKLFNNTGENVFGTSEIDTSTSVRTIEISP